MFIDFCFQVGSGSSHKRKRPKSEFASSFTQSTSSWKRMEKGFKLQALQSCFFWDNVEGFLLGIPARSLLLELLCPCVCNLNNHNCHNYKDKHIL